METSMDLQLFGVLFGGGGGGGGTVQAKAPVSSAPGSSPVAITSEETENARKKVRRRVFNKDVTNATGGALGATASDAETMAKRLLGE